MGSTPTSDNVEDLSKYNPGSWTGRKTTTLTFDVQVLLESWFRCRLYDTPFPSNFYRHRAVEPRVTPPALNSDSLLLHLSSSVPGLSSSNQLHYSFSQLRLSDWIPLDGCKGTPWPCFQGQLILPVIAHRPPPCPLPPQGTMSLELTSHRVIRSNIDQAKPR